MCLFFLFEPSFSCAKWRKTRFVLSHARSIARRGIYVVFSVKDRIPEVREGYGDHGASVRRAITVCMLFATGDGV